VPYVTIEKAPGSDWGVLDLSVYRFGPNASWSMGWDFGVRDTFSSVGRITFFLELPFNETELPMSRENWRYGRRVRDGISFIMGIDVPFMNETTYWLDKLPNGVEFQVEYSVLSGPFTLGIGEYTSEQTFYTLSSWSHSCPFIDSLGDLSATVFPIKDTAAVHLSNDKANASGCLIDTRLVCDTKFAQDDPNYRNATAEETPSCTVGTFTATLLFGIEVDPGMLAAYAGIATRNGGINHDESNMYHQISLNSIAAAYIMTRELVEGTVAVQGVRASIGPLYIFFMILPLLFVLPLAFFMMKKGPPPPVPRSIWDAMVLGRDEEETIPQRLGSDSAYPQCPNKLKFGITAEESGGFDRLGLGKAFVPLARPL